MPIPGPITIARSTACGDLGVCPPETFAAAFLIAQCRSKSQEPEDHSVCQTSRVLEFVLMANGVGKAKEYGDFILRVA